MRGRRVQCAGSLRAAWEAQEAHRHSEESSLVCYPLTLSGEFLRSGRRQSPRQPQPESLELRTMRVPSGFVWTCSPSTVVSMTFPSLFCWRFEPSR